MMGISIEDWIRLSSHSIFALSGVALAVAAVLMSEDSSFQSAAVFDELKQAVEKDPSLVSKVKGVFRFDITNASGKKKSWVVNLKDGNGSVLESSEGTSDCTIGVKEEVFSQLVAGKVNAQMAFMQGKLKLKGNIMLAQKLETIFSAVKKSQQKSKSVKSKL
jgi:3-hydroxyacyl-CoA dehydrogenase/3a,7a,12a-trihydroxy-5b-cholest-24-enoyl-CoA hydratase